MQTRGYPLAVNAAPGPNQHEMHPAPGCWCMPIATPGSASLSDDPVGRAHREGIQSRPIQEMVLELQSNLRKMWFTRGIITSSLTSMYIRLGSRVVVTGTSAFMTAVRSRLSCRLSRNEFNHRQLSKWKFTCTGLTWTNILLGGTVMEHNNKFR